MPLRQALWLSIAAVFVAILTACSSTAERPEPIELRIDVVDQRSPGLVHASG